MPGTRDLDTLRLLLAFMKIADPVTRLAILRIIEQAARPRDDKPPH
jgi:hypothetical protein